jgi:hypothetical protein
MTQANDSILVTPGSGATVATHLANSKEHQVVMLADELGVIYGSRPVYCANLPSSVFVNSANTVHFDLFNADAALRVRVMHCIVVPDMVTAVATGVATSWKLARTTSAGTGGSAITPWPINTDTAVIPALDADITCRQKPTGGASEGTILRNWTQHGEETNTGTIVAAALGGFDLIPQVVRDHGGIVLNQNQGIRGVQITSTALGNTGFFIVFAVD